MSKSAFLAGSQETTLIPHDAHTYPALRILALMHDNTGLSKTNQAVNEDLMKITTMITCALLWLSSVPSCARHHHSETRHLQEGTFDKANAVSISRSGSFELDMTPDQALPLFTAHGETLWVPHWEPVILKGDGFREGTIWITSHGLQKTYWTVLDYDLVNHRAHYSLVTPELKMGTVEVILKPNGSGGSRARVSYELTALSDEGNKRLEKHFSEAAYAEMMKTWRRLINEHREAIEAHLAR